MFKFLKNLFSPVQIPPQKPESHPLDGATRAAHDKNPLIANESAPAVKEEVVVIVEIGSDSFVGDSFILDAAD